MCNIFSYSHKIYTFIILHVFYYSGLVGFMDINRGICRDLEKRLWCHCSLSFDWKDRDCRGLCQGLRSRILTVYYFVKIIAYQIRILSHFQQHHMASFLKDLISRDPPLSPQHPVTGKYYFSFINLLKSGYSSPNMLNLNTYSLPLKLFLCSQSLLWSKLYFKNQYYEF